MDNKSSHRPPHRYDNQSIYFLTGRIFQNANLLKENLQKKIFLAVLKNLVSQYGIKLYAWVVLDNHYHLLFYLPCGAESRVFINRLHSVVALKLNEKDEMPGRKVWYQYWDHTIRDETDFWKHFNYIHHNPVKHGLCENLSGTFDYPFSSAEKWVKIKGEEWFNSCFELHPIVDFTAGE